MKLLTNDSAGARGVRTSLQALVGFFIGLILVIWNTPGVPQNIQNYLQPYELQLLMLIGIPTVFGSGFIAFLLHLWKENNQPPIVSEPPVTPVAETGMAQ